MENGNLKIRRITHGDTEALLDLFRSFSERTRYMFRPHPFDEKQAAFITGEELLNPDFRRYLAFLKVDGRDIAVGYPFLWEWTKEVPTLGIGIRDGYQGMGLGRKMMEFLIREARENRKKGLQLTTYKENVNAQALYKKCGFVITGEGLDGSIGFYEMQYIF